MILCIQQDLSLEEEEVAKQFIESFLEWIDKYNKSLYLDMYKSGTFGLKLSKTLVFRRISWHADIFAAMKIENLATLDGQPIDSDLYIDETKVKMKPTKFTKYYQEK
jgi:hypothetical protein